MDAISNEPVVVHRTAVKIAKRCGEILGEEFPVEKVYPWIKSGKLHAHNIGVHVAITDDQLVADLTGRTP